MGCSNSCVAAEVKPPPSDVESEEKKSESSFESRSSFRSSNASSIGFDEPTLLDILIYEPSCGALYQKALQPKNLPEDYLKQGPLEKQQILWDNITSNPYVELPPVDASSTSLYRMNPFARSFVDFDELPPPGRRARSRGAAARVNFKSTRLSPFSGLYSSGGAGILRINVGLPEARDIDYTVASATLKLFVDGDRSINLFTFASLVKPNFTIDINADEIPSLFDNIFSSEFTNTIPSSSDALWMDIVGGLVRHACGRTEPTHYMPVNEAAYMDSHGNPFTYSAVTPHKLIFTPSPQYKALSKTVNLASDDFRIRLASLREGTVLFKVSAVASAKDPDHKRIHVGDIVLRSRFVAAAYVDDFYQCKLPQAPGTVPALLRPIEKQKEKKTVKEVKDTTHVTEVKGAKDAELSPENEIGINWWQAIVPT